MNIATRTTLFLAILAVNGSAQSVQLVSRTLYAGANGSSVTVAASDDGRFLAFESDASNLVPGDTNGERDVFWCDRYSGVVRRVSVSSDGAQASAASFYPTLSGDGRFVCFHSHSDELVPGDTNGASDIFVHDLQTGVTSFASHGAGGVESNGPSYASHISSGGRYVAFVSAASNLVAGDTNGQQDVFVRDRLLATTERVNLGVGGAQSNGYSFAPQISADGRYVAFVSHANNLVPGDTNNADDLFVYDRHTASMQRASVSSSGAQANDSILGAALSADGRYVAFTTGASNLAPNDVNSEFDIFVRDLSAGVTVLASVSSTGVHGNFRSQQAWLSADGQRVAFVSWADNLVPDDTNFMADVFVRDLATGLTTRVSSATNGPESNGPSYTPRISGDGLVVVFESGASNLVPGDGNAQSDVFAYDALLRCFADADQDGYGDADSGVGSAGPACRAGQVDNGLDCDDTNAATHPFAVELCDGIDNDCDGEVDEDMLTSYCTSGVSQQGCSASIVGLGAADATSSSGFEIRVENVPGGRNGLIFYGSSDLASAWAFNSTSFLCVQPPRQRMSAQDSGGSSGACNGVLTEDWNAWRAAHPAAFGSPFAIGQVFYAQGWYRDPGAPANTNLSNGLRFVLCN